MSQYFDMSITWTDEADGSAVLFCRATDACAAVRLSSGARLASSAVEEDVERERERPERGCLRCVVASAGKEGERKRNRKREKKQRRVSVTSIVR